MVFTIEVNHKPLKAYKGETIYQALSRNGIKVPTLCHMERLAPSGACRVCVVEVEGFNDLVPSCSFPVQEWMKIKTHSPRVIKARKMLVELLLSNHPDDCTYCVRNTNCELQRLAKELGINERRFVGKKTKLKMDQSSPSIIADPSKCIACGRCVRVCEEIQSVSAIDFVKVDEHIGISTAFQKNINVSSCVTCGQCIMVCPTAALTERNYSTKLQEALYNKEMFTAIQYSPTLSVSLSEEFELEAGKDVTGKINAALRKMGFDKIFDTGFAADIYSIEIAADLLQRIKNNEKLPLLTSCCPAWVKFAEQFFPNFLPNLTTTKSPQQILGTIIKKHLAEELKLLPKKIYSASIMPCIAKKFESQRDGMIQKSIPDVDTVLTTREFAQLIRMHGIDMKQISPEGADSPFDTRSSSGKLFATSGGIAEAMLRTLYHQVTGKDLVQYSFSELRNNDFRKEFHFKIEEIEVGIAVVSGLKNARMLLNEIENGRKDIHFIEILACEGGCVAGGGQPILTNKKIIEKRQEAIYEIDALETLKFPYKNQTVTELYQKYFGEPLSEESKKFLHTSYKKRDVLI